MQQKLFRALTFSAFLLLAAPHASKANDLSISPSITDYTYDPSDPVTQVLAIEELDVWGRIRNGFGIPDLNNPLVLSQTNWYSARPEYIQRTTLRASRYLFHVLQELEKRDMPTELALLPFIESAFNPEAYSSAKASGMWQFIPSTGLDFNLKQNLFKDERRDVLASTDAALTYLQKLHGMFGDWQLALAAYNWGEGSVQRAIKKNQANGLPTDFNSLSALMPAETRNYVPKLQAVKNIIATPEAFGITLPKADNQPYFVTIGKTRDIDLKVAAQLAEITLDEFKSLNPQFNRPVITGSASTKILLPQQNAERFKINLAQWNRPLSSWMAHTVTKRERIEAIAALFNTEPQLLREVNHIPPNMRLKAGSTILVPKTAKAAETDITAEVADNAVMSMEPDVPDFRRIAVRVGKRDNLASIAQRYNVTVAQVKNWNDLQRDTLRSGQTLHVQVPYRASAKTGQRTVRVAANRPHHKDARSDKKLRNGPILASAR
ncbi:transglycosylase SLT domain-containing protein [Actimicrobium sp. CCC2.4]|uniref:transglycosylase SLT domain-containing protein n=1 Tax=Actimicrobium sp. CCC2.4 TaxID=3048606 RepID=UPI002AC9D044|nr:transglycosylase SLT domain-containing protein [Actimicrobium sp. CCC2.4]MEB0136587.1 transglycosylase SLT domain-containing protein [Actimicrobium sp. CCC2.4]WPX31727.1 transglycosylase SLT domain-containing protein [Actimicrobium sp. CCC2.4]